MKNPSLFVSTVVLLSTGQFLTASAAPFQNGSFENGLTGWTIVVNSGGERVSSIEGATAGNVAFNFNAYQVFGDGILAQTFSTSIGQTYLVSFDFGSYGLTNGYTQQLQVDMRDGTSAVSGAEIINPGFASITVGNNTGFSFLLNGSVIDVADTLTPANDTAYFGSVPNNPEFSTIAFKFTALSDNSTIVFSDLTGYGGQYTDSVLDNVTVTAVPEPSVLGLGLFSVFGMFFRRKFSR